MNNRHRTLVVITGPTCSGKSTLERAMCQLEHYGRIVSYTTRPHRHGEQNGVDYNFVDEVEFQRMAQASEFLEFAEFGEHFYGTATASVEAVWRTGLIPVAVMEPIGRGNAIAWADHAGVKIIPVWLTNPADVRAARFIERAFSEFTLSMMSAKRMPQAITKAENRLAQMLGEEATWGPAKHEHSISFNRFDANNGLQVTSKLHRHVLSINRQHC